MPLVYEVVRLTMLIAVYPEYAMKSFPVSWYAASPLLVLCPILVLLYLFDDAYSTVYFRVYSLTKFLSALGITTYIIGESTAALANRLSLNGNYVLKRFGLLLIFLVFDVILYITLLKWERKKNHTDVIDC
ncbi:MAG: hypothetical protein LBS64_03785 [Spirochaetaceae bacterium]|nr:hypothetical protein [Spirochaetaceae bacterium]